MNEQNQKPINADKFELIYQFNNSSPLFARVGAKYYEAGNIEEAISVLEKGLKIYPNYPTPYFVYGICLAAAGNLADARKAIMKGSELIGSEETVNYYLEKIENIPADKSSGSLKNKITFFEENYRVEDELKTVQAEEPKFESTVGEKEKTSVSELNLDKLAKELSNATIKPSEELVDESEIEEIQDNDMEFPGKSLVSETLAKIYFNQGNYREALSIYETLVDIQPAKKEYYSQKILQIKKQLTQT